MTDAALENDISFLRAKLKEQETELVELRRLKEEQNAVIIAAKSLEQHFREWDGPKDWMAHSDAVEAFRTIMGVVYP